MDGHDGLKAQRLAGLLAEVDRMFRDDFKRSNGVPCDLSLAQYEVVSMVSRYEEQGRKCSQKVVAEALNVTGPTVVRIIDALENKHLVRRNRDEGDRRIVLLSLTEKGVQVQRDCARMHLQRLSSIMDRMSSHTTDALLDNLSDLVTATRPT